MGLRSVNVSQPKEVRRNDKIITTGIFKESVPAGCVGRAKGCREWRHGGSRRGSTARNVTLPAETR